MVRVWLLAVLLASLALAQKDTGELRLTVKDRSGSPVRAQVDLVNQASKTKVSVYLGRRGRYTFKDLAFGDYLLTVTQAGFSPFSQLVGIQSTLPAQRNIVLTIQPQQTSVEVKASNTLLNPRKTSAAYFTGKQQIAERPMTQPGRGLINLAVLQPGWTLEANGILHPRESEYDTQFIVDGFPVQDNRSPAFARPVEADDVESMKQYTSGMPAEFGDKLGGVIVLTTVPNSSPGFHGTYIAQGGSFSTLSSFLSGQYTAGRTTVSASGEGFL
ncbi:MAG: carboxypeptidase regulatory-like domain-containing protein, partial [Bryobacteraceae bacterium]